MSENIQQDMFDEERLTEKEQAQLEKTSSKLAEKVLVSAPSTGSGSTTKELSKLRREQVRQIVKTAPPEYFIKKHPFGGFDYIPIAILDPLAEALDPNTKNEILREGNIANGFYCVVRLYFNGKTYDGIGAAEFQTAKGAAPTDFTKLITGAVAMGVPKARSEASKNAYAQIGDLFGRGLRRQHNIPMQQMENSTLLRAINPEVEEATKKLQAAESQNDLKDIFMSLPFNIKKNKTVQEVKNKMKELL